jgi:hypothetical protein
MAALAALAAAADAFATTTAAAAAAIASIATTRSEPDVCHVVIVCATGGLGKFLVNDRAPMSDAEG